MQNIAVLETLWTLVVTSILMRLVHKLNERVIIETLIPEQISSSITIDRSDNKSYVQMT